MQEFEMFSSLHEYKLTEMKHLLYDRNLIFNEAQVYLEFFKEEYEP